MPQQSDVDAGPAERLVAHCAARQRAGLEVKAADRPAPAAREAAGLPADTPVPAATVCRIVRQLVAELVLLAGDRVLHRRDSRRAGCQVRQIAMYLCHVALQISLTEIGLAFGRDRTTVGHACNVVEDRRDQPAFDAFLATAERMVLTVFGPVGGFDR
ncbi:hypothetical protein LXM94_01350 [Rhizobium sp. TRM95111]|uniref:helix-turn-helix domain-containing protein n=1 Tax=Rhizobium alarense TaxID=2846851 RepID=UPI001F22B1D2|nr:helix-turn-helix domain-containing protein [Rhizobium alarense]MCF3638615.1 hypothetical protein [Rhizobium alarense]